MILFSFEYVLIGQILLALLTMTKISYDCHDADSGPKIVLCGQFQNAIWENSVSFKHTSYYRRIYITKDHEQSCTELTAWSRQNGGEYCADTYFLESQNLEMENFLTHVAAAEWLIGLKRLLLGSQETRRRGGNLTILLISTYSILQDFDPCTFRHYRIHLLSSVPLPSPVPHSHSQSWSWVLNGI